MIPETTQMSCIGALPLDRAGGYRRAPWTGYCPWTAPARVPCVLTLRIHLLGFDSVALERPKQWEAEQRGEFLGGDNVFDQIDHHYYL